MVRSLVIRPLLADACTIFIIGVVPTTSQSLIPYTSADSYAVLKETELMGHSDRIWTLQASLGRLVTGRRVKKLLQELPLIHDLNQHD